MKLTAFTPELTIHEVSDITRYRIKDYKGANPWCLLGGSVLAMAQAHDNNDSHIHQVKLQFHGGRNTWMVENERWSRYTIFPRDDNFGSLQQMCEIFQQRTLIDLPDITLKILNQGIVRVNARETKWDAANPWELVPGRIYRAQGSGGHTREFQAISLSNGKIEVRHWPHQDGNESFDPKYIFKGEDWLMVGTANALAAAECETTSPDAIETAGPTP